ncbi:MAG TPA: GxxExxY protein [Gemmatimonadaceae bacterium]|nr:GxxExxY protein [Gemmatimonadaceae bacterium]
MTGGFYEVYNTLGFGFREHIYKMALERELRERGHLVQRERLIDVFYKNKRLGRDRIDLIVDEVLVIGIKSTTYLNPGARDQLYSYLRSTNFEVGLLLHFGPNPASIVC